MSTTIERLLVLQDCDRKLSRLEREKRDIPLREKGIRSRLDAQQHSLQTAQDALKQAESDIRQIEIEVESLNEKIAKFRQQQFQIKNNEEYKALEKEIALAQKNISKCEDREITAMDAADAHRTIVREREKDLGKEQAVVDQDLAMLQERADVLTGEIEQLKTQRNELLPDIDVRWLRRYERILEHVGDYAVVPVESSACGGCQMNLPPHVVNEVKKGLNLTVCNYCGRILYWKPY